MWTIAGGVVLGGLGLLVVYGLLRRLVSRDSRFYGCLGLIVGLTAFALVYFVD